MNINSEFIELYGYLAAILTTIAFLPQLYKTWNSKSAEDVSLIMLVCFISGLLLWIIYGLKIGSLPILIANIITLMFNLGILILKLIYKT